MSDVKCTATAAAVAAILNHTLLSHSFPLLSSVSLFFLLVEVHTTLPLPLSTASQIVSLSGQLKRTN